MSIGVLRAGRVQGACPGGGLEKSSDLGVNLTEMRLRIRQGLKKGKAPAASQGLCSRRFRNLPNQCLETRVKIARIAETIPFLNRVQEKQDAGGGSSSQQQQQQQQKKNPYAKQQEANPEEVKAAVQGFETDAQAQANGLSAATIGVGPGLRVVLKDANGAVLRQFTGEEFLRLRENASQDAGARGKILDRKL